MDSKKYRFETLQIHAGLQPDEPTGARGVAIYPTAAYRFKNCDHAARLFELSEGGNIYTRLQNPTTTAYEQRIAALYGAVGALAVSSGMSAILIAVLSLAAEGDNIVASPFDSYLMMIGLETLSLRVKHQVESTWKLAEYCRSHPKVERVSFVGFDTHPSHENARKYYRYGSSAVFTVELKGTLESTVRFVESLRLAANMTMIGDSITVVTHPASTTHKQLSDADLTAAGVTPTLLRISLGLENADDLIEDFEQAFAQIG